MKKFERAMFSPEQIIEKKKVLSQNLPDGCTQEQLDSFIQRELVDAEVWVNDSYQVVIRRDCPTGEDWPNMVHLSIKRLDKAAAHDWRDFQEIKNQLIGPLHEAVELYPSEDRLVDTANQYHLWVLADPEIKFPFGFTTKAVEYTEIDGLGEKQRPKGE